MKNLEDFSTELRKFVFFTFQTITSVKITTFRKISRGWLMIAAMSLTLLQSQNISGYCIKNKLLHMIQPSNFRFSLRTCTHKIGNGFR